MEGRIEERRLGQRKGGEKSRRENGGEELVSPCSPAP